MRRLHIKLTLGLPLMVDAELNKVLATPDTYWQNFVRVCAAASDQALFVAGAGGRCSGMGHVRLEGSQARLGMLYVEGRSRRQGTGGALAAAQESWALASGATDLICHIPEKSAAGPLAEKLGWQRTEETFYTRHGLKEHKWTRACEQSGK